MGFNMQQDQLLQALQTPGGAYQHIVGGCAAAEASDCSSGCATSVSQLPQSQSPLSQPLPQQLLKIPVVVCSEEAFNNPAALAAHVAASLQEAGFSNSAAPWSPIVSPVCVPFRAAPPEEPAPVARYAGPPQVKVPPASPVGLQPAPAGPMRPQQPAAPPTQEQKDRAWESWSWSAGDDQWRDWHQGASSSSREVAPPADDAMPVDPLIEPPADRPPAFDGMGEWLGWSICRLPSGEAAWQPPIQRETWQYRLGEEPGAPLEA